MSKRPRFHAGKCPSAAFRISFVTRCTPALLSETASDLGERLQESTFWQFGGLSQMSDTARLVSAYLQVLSEKSMISAMVPFFSLEGSSSHDEF